MLATAKEDEFWDRIREVRSHGGAIAGSFEAWLLQRGGAGAHAQEPAPLAVADTVGAGDCFLAGIITALLAGPQRGQEALWLRPGGLTAPLAPDRLQAVLWHALASASHCVEQVGCVPPRYDTVCERLARMRGAELAGRRALQEI